MAVHAPLPAVVMLLSTGGNSSTAMVIGFDCLPEGTAPAAPLESETRPVTATAPETSTVSVRCVTLRVVADIRWPPAPPPIVLADATQVVDGRAGNSALPVTRTARPPGPLRTDLG